MKNFSVAYQKQRVVLFINRSEDEQPQNEISWSSDSKVSFEEALQAAALLEEMSKLGSELVAKFEAGELESFIMGHTFKNDEYEFLAFECKHSGVLGLDINTRKIRFLDYGKVLNEFDAIPNPNRTTELQVCFDALLAIKNRL